MPGPEAEILTYVPVAGPKRRHVFEPRIDGSYQHTEQEWTGEGWRTVGSEIVHECWFESPSPP